MVVIANIVAIWAVSFDRPFSSGHAVAYPLGMAEGFCVYWLLGWWERRSTGVR